MITPQLKDDLLKFIIIESPQMSYDGNHQELCQKFGIEEDVLTAILEQFELRRLLNIQWYMGGSFITVTANAHDYILKGGHLGEFDFLEMQVHKLKNDLYEFESSIPSEKFKKISDTLGLLLTAASTYKSYM